jgi:HAD superfamily hydrolase (TIGR01509 family)
VIKAVVFDCFGVLARDGWLSFRDEHFDKDPELLEKATISNKRVDAGLASYEDFVHEIAELSGVSISDTRRVLEDNVPNDALLTYIRDQLKPSYKIGFLSNAGANWMNDIFQPWQVKLFDEVVISYQLGVIKPHPLMYETIAHKLGVMPEECVLIDDQLRYCEGAEAVNMKAIQFTSNKQAITQLEQLLNGEKK